MLHPGKPLEAANGTPIFGGSTHRLAILFDELRAEGKNAGDRLMNARRGPYFTRAFNVLFGQDTQNVNNGVDEDEQTALALRKYFLALKGMRHEEVQLYGHAFNEVDAQADPRFNKLARYLFSNIPKNFDYANVYLNPRPINFITSTFTALLLHECEWEKQKLTSR
ncbi:hypothetical protein BPOR_1247g00020 [Botrytis porri]|uniref:Uncharacterized protein n=1 Tax=Botrytis porri TaxID=87229 RepID=A0A4Z1KCK2_9HELO|nr:hypothetical protein BPOR_1247g00020 [Botrytis porri]